MVAITLIAYKLCKSNPLPIMSITEVEEGRPMLRTVKPWYTPEKEAIDFGLSTTSTTESRASKGSVQTMTSILNY